MLYFEHFSCREFFPYCSDDEISSCIREGLFDNLLTLFMVLDGFRSYINKPIVITSTFRDSEHNRRVGGVSTSQHLSASAIDFRCPDVPIKTLQTRLKDYLIKSALKMFIGQVIIYTKRNFIHIALRTQTHNTLQFYYYE